MGVSSITATFLLVCLCLPCPSADEVSEGTAPPQLPHYDWNVCPGEGCVYRRWRATKPVLVFDAFGAQRKVIARLRRGDTMMGINGFVVTLKPGVIRIDRDMPKLNLKSGETILTYAYWGEGNAAVWFHGRYDSDFDIAFTRWPNGAGCGGDYCSATYVDLGEQIWWAEVKLPDGKIGWIDMNKSDVAGACAIAE